MLLKHPSNSAVAVAWMAARTQTLGAVLLGLVFALALIASVQPAGARSAPDSFAELADKLLPAVVNISSSQVVRSTQRQDIPQAPPGSPFEDFFKEFFDRNQREGAPRRASSLGSGFIIDKAGLVVTNNHVIADADEITVILHDDSRFPATVVGRDSKTDLALLKIDAKHDLPYVRWGNSSAARVGDWVLAIGNPFGLGGTVTAGIISARQRDINQGPYDSFLQTDASINRGNSGGPMFNMDGKVIGVNTAIFSPTGGSVGVGFSIPSAIAERVIDQLREFGRTKRGWLGVRIQTVTDEIAENLGLDKAAGALVADVTKDGPAQAAKIEPGDVVLKFDGKVVEQMRDLPRIVAETEIGKPVEVEIWHKAKGEKAKRLTVEVVVGELKEDQPIPASTGPGDQPVEPEQAEIAELGVSVTAITKEMRDQFNVPEEVHGVLITGVSGDSGASEKGLRPGDVIVEVNQEEVSSPGQITDKVEEAMKSDRRSVLLLVNRNGDLRFVAVRVTAG